MKGKVDINGEEVEFEVETIESLMLEENFRLLWVRVLPIEELREDFGDEVSAGIEAVLGGRVILDVQDGRAHHEILRVYLLVEGPVDVIPRKTRLEWYLEQRGQRLPEEIINAPWNPVHDSTLPELAKMLSDSTVFGRSLVRILDRAGYLHHVTKEDVDVAVATALLETIQNHQRRPPWPEVNVRKFRWVLIMGIVPFLSARQHELLVLHAARCLLEDWQSRS